MDFERYGLTLVPAEEFDVAVHGKWQYICRICRRMGSIVGYNLDVHFEKCHDIFHPKSGIHYLYFYESMGEKRYYIRQLNGRAKRRVLWDGSLIKHVKTYNNKNKVIVAT